MSQKTRFATLCIFFLIINGCSQNARQAYTPPGGEFSYVPPEHWVMRAVRGFKYQFAFGQENNNFAPNINVVESYAPSKLDDFVTGNLQVLQQMPAGEGQFRVLKILSQTEFTTDFKQRGIKVVAETEYSGKQLRQTFYFFDAKEDKKFVITCSALISGGESYDKIFDSSLRTFKPSGT